MVGTDVKNLRVGKSRSPDIRELLQCGGADNSPIQSRDLGNVSKYWEEPETVPPKGGPPADKYASKEGHNGQVGLTTSGRSYAGSGFEGGGYVRPPPT